jgi:hypothetical protein
MHNREITIQIAFAEPEMIASKCEASAVADADIVLNSEEGQIGPFTQAVLNLSKLVREAVIPLLQGQQSLLRANVQIAAATQQTLLGMSQPQAVIDPSRLRI